MRSIAGVILAAGMSKRFGSTKQLVDLDGKNLLERVVEAAVGSGLTEVFVVLGYQYDRILSHLPHLKNSPKVKILFNPDYQTGMGSSVQCGLTAARIKYDHVMFFVADQPFLSHEIINHLLHKYSQTDKQICIPVCLGRKGNPTIFGVSHFDQLLNISGDKGGREIIADNPENVLRVPIKNSMALFDIDTLEDIKSLNLPFSLNCLD